VAEEDSPLVAVLRAAGAISLGKTQVPEFGLSAYSENLIGPPARNPLRPDLSPGGSSGGSAAAVAAGLIPFAPGTDGGGSVRIPAAATGLVGLKPNRGRVPSGSGQADLGQFVVAGPLARNAADAALLLDALVAEPGYRSTAAAAPAGSFLSAAQRAEGRFRIGVSTVSPFESAFPITLDAPARDALEAGIRALGAAGHDVVEAPLTYDSRYHAAFQTVWTAALAIAPIAEEDEAKLTPLSGTLRQRARARPATELTEAIAVLRQFEYDTIRQYADYDMILTPALGMTPRPIGWYTDADADTDYERQCRYSPYTSMVNVCGLPALVVPTLRTADGLSMAIQLIGRPSAEADLLAVCAAARGPPALKVPAVLLLPAGTTPARPEPLLPSNRERFRPRGRGRRTLRRRGSRCLRPSRRPPRRGRLQRWCSHCQSSFSLSEAEGPVRVLFLSLLTIRPVSSPRRHRGGHPQAHEHDEADDEQQPHKQHDVPHDEPGQGHRPAGRLTPQGEMTEHHREDLRQDQQAAGEHGRRAEDQCGDAQSPGFRVGSRIGAIRKGLRLPVGRRPELLPTVRDAAAGIRPAERVRRRCLRVRPAACAPDGPSPAGPPAPEAPGRACRDRNTSADRGDR
jgi:amidase